MSYLAGVPTCSFLTPVLDLDELPLAQRRQAIAQAMANLRARGVRLSPFLVALYQEYGAGRRTRAQIRAAVLQQTRATRPQILSPLAFPTPEPTP